MVEKNYKIELDVLVGAGPEALTRLADVDNTVFFDIEQAEKRAADPKDPHRHEFDEVLITTNELMKRNGYRPQDQAIFTDAGGTISWKKKLPPNTQHITFSPSRESQLRRAGRKVAFPNFLRYAADTLKSGLITISFDGAPQSLTVEDVIREADIDEVLPNQYVLVNESLLYRVRHKIVPNSDRSRFHIEGEPHLESVHNWDDLTRSKIPRQVTEKWNLEQRLGFSQLVSPDTEICFISGGSGSGKTRVSYVAAVEQLLLEATRVERGEKESTLQQIVIYKSNDVIGGKRRELGALPGDAEEKTEKFYRSYEMAHKQAGLPIHFKQMLLHPRDTNGEGLKRSEKASIFGFYLPPDEAAIEKGFLQFDRGITYVNTLIFIDDAQNYSPFELKHLIERAGRGCKVFVVGDPEQVDNPALSPKFNGLVWVAKALLNDRHPRLSFMYFDKNFRSQTAELMRSHRAPQVY